MNPLSVPSGLHDITPSWLTGCLGRSCDNGTRFRHLLLSQRP